MLPVFVTAIVYRTVKGWQYGIEGRASHGAGHALCSAGFFAAVAPLLPKEVAHLPCCDGVPQRCNGGSDGQIVLNTATGGMVMTMSMANTRNR